jgi:hypothetical protein
MRKSWISTRHVGIRAVVRFGLVLALAQLSCCTRAELENKAEAYNAAIAESSNQQILLNAVRASQRAPMSFVSFGDVSATPTFSGSAAGTFNFDPFGLTTYTLNPSVNVGGGFNTFGMSNLNSSEFMAAVQKPLDKTTVQYFSDLKFPQELIQMIFVQSYVVSRAQYDKIKHDVDTRCATKADARTEEICQRLAEDRAAFEAAGCFQFPEGQTITVLDTAREYCSMNEFQTFARKLRLLNMSLPFRIRSVQGMLYFLGELIAAQNYSAQPYFPTIYVDAPDGHRRLVPLFVVRRRPPAPGEAAVTVIYQNETFYIPRPEIGAIDEARSLQVLDLVSQAMAAATSKGDLPKSSTVTLVTAR